MTDTTEQVVDQPAPDAIEPETVETPETEQAESSPAVNDADESSEPKPKGVQKRIDELTRLRYDAERDRDYWRDLATRQQPQATPETAKPEAPKPLPKLEDFNYDEAAYQQALFKHASEEAARQVREELRREQEQKQKQERVKSWKTREAEFIAKTPDYKQVAYYAPISDAMADVIQESELGPQIAYYLGKHTAEAEQIAQLDPVRAACALGRIEARLEKPAAPPPPPKQVSKAPPPPPKIEATDATPRVSTTSPDSDKLTDDEWVKAERARLQRKQKRVAAST